MKYLDIMLHISYKNNITGKYGGKKEKTFNVYGEHSNWTHFKCIPRFL